MMATAFKTGEDAVLVAAAAAGQEKAFEVLIERHFQAVFLAAYARLGQREAAEDLAQEVFLKAYLHLSALQEPDRFAQWVCRVARNLASDWRRRAQTASRLTPLVTTEETSMENIPDPAGEDLRDRLDRGQRLEAVRRALDELPENLREMVLLHYLEGLNDRQVAERLGVHRTTVRYHLGRALDRFRLRLSPLLGERGPSEPQPLRARRDAVIKATAVVAAASAMSASQKVALAAASGGVASPSALLPLLNTLKTALHAGGLPMTTGKSTAAALTTAGLMLAGGSCLVIAAVQQPATAPLSLRNTSPAAAPVQTADAGELTGIWMGPLKIRNGKTIRVVYRIRQSPDGALYGTADSPDEKQGGLVVDRILLTGDQVRIETLAVEAIYEGHLRGQRLEGAFVQHGTSLPLTLERVDHGQAPVVPPPPARTQVKLAPALLDQYVGEYAAGPQTLASVTREGDHLRVKITGFASLPAYPETENQFFFRAFNAQLTFFKNQQGRVDRLVRHMGSKQLAFRRVR